MRYEADLCQCRPCQCHHLTDPRELLHYREQDLGKEIPDSSTHQQTTPDTSSPPAHQLTLHT